ncbi:hypothetical protein AA103196_3121 [Ameyamaea chiangmaiensis NBRC 103196]|uniref:Uncharacterized protein n=1 Tax=Ameyamaea chiangmaiensis TaxID=442969 RepID=A0A850P8R9_9PROT|nr:hypothetical protein [Ameyamaea chiangmaiensis]MBS4074607.1 hypothetical protein [Ameyamaea chiangmaiensis]NVN39363.1 hypothetical protein [Ameyamaea chiangmaiensis]GBQ72646.1 hypothetical protein AA103196_3121 [Ameyamaea chiangmaiensis NBRC 103196]
MEDEEHEMMKRWDAFDRKRLSAEEPFLENWLANTAQLWRTLHPTADIATRNELVTALAVILLV